MLPYFTILLVAIGLASVRAGEEVLQDIQNLKDNASKIYELRDEKLRNLTEYAEDTHTKRIAAIELRRQRGERLMEKAEGIITNSNDREANVTTWFLDLLKTIDQRRKNNEERFQRKLNRVDKLLQKFVHATTSPPHYELLCPDDEPCTDV